MTTAAPEVPATLTTTPHGGMIPAARVYHLIVALVGTSALAISLFLSATSPVNGGALNGMIFTLSYFTVWSNIFALIINWALFADPTRDGKGFRWLRMTSLVMIVITGLIYAIILAATANPCGWGVYTNLGFHYIVPWATLLGFLIFGPRPRFTWDLVPKMMIIPVLWLVYTLIHGAFTSNAPGDTCTSTPLTTSTYWYPYPFINVDYNGTGAPSPLVPGLEAQGYAGVAINLVVIIILGLVMASIFVGLDRLLSKRRKPTPLNG
jgi:hypothetical protein